MTAEAENPDPGSSGLTRGCSSSGSGEHLGFLENLPRPGAPLFWEYAPGKVLAWNEYGDPSGQPVFYYHGWPSSRLQARLAHHLAGERGIRLISMDRPGMGKSTFVPERNLEDWPALSVRFADHLGIGKFGQLGVSGGGPYVLACAAEIPDRLTASAVLAGMVPLPLTDHGRSGLHPLYRALIPLRKLPAPCFTLGFRIAAVACGLPPHRFPMFWLLRSLAEDDRAIMRHSGEIWDVITESFTEGVRGVSGGRGIMTDAEIYLRKPAFGVEKISHPVQYWHGGDDRNIPASLVRELTRKMPAATLHFEPALGHFSLAVRRAAIALEAIASR